MKIYEENEPTLKIYKVRNETYPIGEELSH